MENSVGKALKEQREMLGLSQAELAKQLQFSQQAVSLWEADKRAPSIYACIKLADFYGITMDELIGREI